MFQVNIYGLHTIMIVDSEQCWWMLLFLVQISQLNKHQIKMLIKLA